MNVDPRLLDRLLAQEECEWGTDDPVTVESSVLVKSWPHERQKLSGFDGRPSGSTETGLPSARVKWLGVMLLTAACITASAQASRAPRPAERTAIVRATRIYVDTSNCCAVISRIKVYGIRVSTVNPRWARIDFDGYDESGQEVGGVGAILHKGILTGRWSVRSFGTSHLGCDIPLRVRKDLRTGC